MPREYVSNTLRQLVNDRADGYCEYCSSSGDFALESMEIEHIMPVSQGGATIAENLALACHGCNNYKQARVAGFDPISSESVPLYNPRKMSWDNHFAWSKDTTLLIGLTATGRATITLLKLNRVGVVNLRQVLHVVGKHPPQKSA
jgi:HNH endonuclease